MTGAKVTALEIENATKVAALEVENKNLKERIVTLEKDVEFLKRTINRWMGGFTILIVLGSVIGALFEKYIPLRKMFGLGD